MLICKNKIMGPRRNILSLNTEAEIAIFNAMQEVEKVGADVKLTEVVTLLAKAKEILADYEDSKCYKK